MSFSREKWFILEMRGSMNFQSGHVISSEGRQEIDCTQQLKTSTENFIEITELESALAPLQFVQFPCFYTDGN